MVRVYQWNFFSSNYVDWYQSAPVINLKKSKFLKNFRWLRGKGKSEEYQEPEEQKPFNEDSMDLTKKKRKRSMKLPPLKPACSAATVELCHDIDVCSFYISPPIFLIFNLAYWITYLNYDFIVLNKSWNISNLWRHHKHSTNNRET